MKKTKLTRSLLAACSIVALTAVMYGCVHDGGDDAPADDMSDVMPPDPPPPANLTSLFAAAQEASDDAAMAGENAMAAEMAAKESAGMLLATEVGGESTTAMESAQAILDASDDAAQAVMDAEAALAAAKKAEMDAMGIADDHPQKSALDAAIDAAIEAAEAQLKAATAVRDGTALKNAVAEVTGGASGTGTPRSVANVVGNAISAALMPPDTGAQRTGTRITAHSASGPAVTIVAGHKYQTDDHTGMTWAEIVGEDNVMSERIGADNAAKMVASVAGMTAANVDSDVTASGGTNNDGQYNDAFTSSDSTYLGIPGDIFCLGGDDGCKVTDDKLGAGWYFSPTSETAYYQRQADNPETDADESLTYEAETLYASYGHWLTTDGTDWTVNTFSSSAGGTEVNTDAGTEDNMLKDTATYSGSAAGMSVRRMGSGNSATTDSGRFTADVMLTANFGASPTVRGTIDNFMGSAVGLGWSVNLESTTLGTAEQSGVATGSGRDGEWDATAYGSDNTARPTGIHGGFVAHFSDGDAAGAYATRLDE